MFGKVGSVACQTTPAWEFRPAMLRESGEWQHCRAASQDHELAPLH
jgi:hypothetical protein